MNPTQLFVLGQKEKISLFLNLIFFSEKNFQLNSFSLFFQLWKPVQQLFLSETVPFVFEEKLHVHRQIGINQPTDAIYLLPRNESENSFSLQMADHKQKKFGYWIVFVQNTFLNVCSTCLWFAIQFFTNFYSRPDMDYRNGENLFLKPLKNPTRRGYTEWMRLAWTYRQF